MAISQGILDRTVVIGFNLKALTCEPAKASLFACGCSAGKDVGSGVADRRPFAASQSSSANCDMLEDSLEAAKKYRLTYLGKVTSDAVGQDDDNHVILLESIILRGLRQSGDGTSTASTNQKTFLGD